MRSDKPEDAEDDFGKAIQINPNDGWSYLGRAWPAGNGAITRMRMPT